MWTNPYLKSIFAKKFFVTFEIQNQNKVEIRFFPKKQTDVKVFVKILDGGKIRLKSADSWKLYLMLKGKFFAGILSRK